MLEVDSELQKAMCIATEQLGMLCRVHQEPRESRRLQAEITGIVHWLEFLSQQREHGMRQATAEGIEQVKLVARPVCEACRQTAKASRDNTNAMHDVAPSPVWQSQLEFLLRCVKTVGSELFVQNCASCEVRKFPESLARLMNLLRQLQRYSAHRGAGIGAETLPGGCCAKCGQAIQAPSESVS